MHILDNTEIDEKIVHVKFACDLHACKGACCTLHGGKGAPLLDEELKEIDKAFPLIKHYLPQEHVNVIERDGMYEGSADNYTTMCIDHRACVFVYYEQGIAKCSFERAYLDGVLQWRKPISCHLFPIRADRLFTERLRYEYISECGPALDRGLREDVFLSDFLSDALQRLYGKGWYDRFRLLCRKLRTSGVLQFITGKATDHD